MVYWVDDPNGAAQPPVPPPDTGLQNYFQEEDAANGVKKVYIRAWLLNMLLQELLAIAQWAGIVPSKTGVNQVLQALQKMFVQPTAWSRMFSGAPGQAYGYTRHPDGTLVQSGFVPKVGNQQPGSFTPMFPIAFPTRVTSIKVSVSNTTSATVTATYEYIDLTKFTINTTDDYSVDWEVTGY